ncbi:hypothetical protein T439DRAFT_325753 [Meredithblackwellia eburnea MCA 4105]
MAQGAVDNSRWTPPSTPSGSRSRIDSSRLAPPTPDTPNRFHRFLPTNLFPFDIPFPGSEWRGQPTRVRVAEGNNSSIDWNHELAKERQRVQDLLEIPGLAGVGARLWDVITPWLVVVATGVATGVLAACLDVLSSWLSDLRSGVCTDTWWMSKGACCTGLDAGEACNAWQTWGQVVGGHFIKRSLTQYAVYMVLAVLFAVTSSVFVQIYAPFAFHTGIPEIKTILGGYIITDFLSGWTLLIKSLGLPLAVASGLSLGKEGPLVHVACCIGNLLLRPFEILKGNEARQREILSAAAAAGVSVAFGAPLGGVLFSLEEVSTFFPGSTLWQSFVCAIVAAVTLQYIDPFGTGKLVLFEVTTSQVFRGFEVIPWTILGVAGGIWGAWFIALNEDWERFRKASGLNRWPVTEVAALSLFTAVVSYLVIFMRIPSSELVANLFQDCSAADMYGLCDTSKSTMLVALLLVTAFSKSLLTAVTFGASLPAGIFLPTLVIGACGGRAVGIVMSSIQRSHPTAWLFSNCPADGVCISPPVYAVVGAASAMGGVTRMTVSLVVILFELTGAVDLVLQIMMGVMISKFTADFFSKAGIYENWINIRNYPFLNNKIDYRNDSVLAKDVMTPVKNLVFISDEGWTFNRLEALVDVEEYRGFPIVRTLGEKMILGFIGRLELEAAIIHLRQLEDITPDSLCFFTNDPNRGPRLGVSTETEEGAPGGPPAMSKLEREQALAAAFGEERPDQIPWVSLKSWMDETPFCVHPDTPMEVVVQMFQRLGLRSMLFTKQGVLQGLVTKMDIHAHMQPDPAAVERRVKPRAARATGRTPTTPTANLANRRPSAREETTEEFGLLDNMSVASEQLSGGGPSRVSREQAHAWGF